MSGMKLNRLLCIVSPHEKGFWQADVYEDGWEECVLPDWFCTGKIGGTRDEIIEKVRIAYPDATFESGVTGVCLECGESYFNLENECECDGIVGET